MYLDATEDGAPLDREIDMGWALIRRAQRLPVAARGVKDAVSEGDPARVRPDLVLKDLYGAKYAALYGDAQRRACCAARG